MTEQEIGRALGERYSAGTEAFRDALLARCLAVLGSDNQPVELMDEGLARLAAAGDPTSFWGTTSTGNEWTQGR